jgi:transcriptional regulator with XRE-family HTH domain
MTGAQIKAGRLAQGWTQVELAEALDVAPETISRWENDVIFISTRSKLALRSLLGQEESKSARSKRRKS